MKTAVGSEYDLLVTGELDALLTCGDFEHGFLVAECQRCGDRAPSRRRTRGGGQASTGGQGHATTAHALALVAGLAQRVLAALVIGTLAGDWSRQMPRSRSIETADAGSRPP